MANRGDQKGPQQHAEGQQGEKTHRRFIEQLNEGSPRERSEQEVNAQPGGHRIHEDRQQHDEAEKNSEKNRLAIDADRGRADPDDHNLNGGADSRS
jgi:hypothetical protein